MIYQKNDLTQYVEYWNRDFKDVLQWYYQDWGHKDGPIRNIILSAKHNSFYEIRPRILFGQSHINADEYFFSASMYYLSVIPQIICKICSPRAARNFLNSSGWPAISLGLGGFMSAEQILYESELLPYPNEVVRYISLLNIVHDFHKKELENYLSGNEDSLSLSEYSLLLEEVKESRELIIDELNKCQSEFIKVCEKIKESQKNPWQPMYMENNCSFYN